MMTCQGFEEVDSEQWEFANEEFIRGQRHLLKNIYRRKPIHSHSAATGQSVAPLTDSERQEYEDEIERLKKENSLLQSSAENQDKFNQEYEFEIKSMEQRLQNVAQRQGKLISLLAQLLRRPEFISILFNALTVAPRRDGCCWIPQSILGTRFLYGIRTNPTEDNQMCDFEHTQPLPSPIVIREIDTSSDDSGKRNSPIDHSPSPSRDIQSSPKFGGGSLSVPVISSIYVNLECQLKSPKVKSNGTTAVARNLVIDSTKNQFEGNTTKTSESVSNSGNDVFWQQFSLRPPSYTGEPQKLTPKT
ncbi:hypothetical protein HAX54_019724 [Datura stramonium]|uniref:Uncharacterized protein n=1 Tax=Datura stramonium TaxID=4076 RepID=A0ABS8URY7_DATST|nr:hypothetical protein [Datura stramonium]